MNESELTAEARSIVRSFAGTLKPKLKEAIATGGFEHAISICSVEAPGIAKSLSETSGWSVKRVSLKPRNKYSGTPDAYEREVLERFDARQASGESPATIEQSALVNGEFRYMKAQPVEGVCLGCHGESIAPPVRAALQKYYPDDAASGYNLGQIRGAFSLSRVLENTP
ncbi:Tll0287-like domain-containing protein [Biformimicrobium ophioploci]|uniref:DUF3365 domain-containing protein n=1 Tax=Biformimicrobium ophioploci TaxID=3036711 RepID=A0ABQ6LZF0_9GAMM|nr:DUF3365 domain-containing protein [Microbulbifer sp. NKW57]GMG87452.1 DUF3365 domain-containing protein [Microbulbifer sp. NKW57]